MDELRLHEVTESGPVFNCFNCGLPHPFQSVSLVVPGHFCHSLSPVPEGRQRKGRVMEFKWVSSATCTLLSSQCIRGGGCSQGRCGYNSLCYSHPSPVLPGNLEWAVWKWFVGWKKKGGALLSLWSFFKEGGVLGSEQHVTENSQALIKQTHVWMHTISSTAQEMKMQREPWLPQLQEDSEGSLMTRPRTTKTEVNKATLNHYRVGNRRKYSKL